jgi:hypothetical protein
VTTLVLRDLIDPLNPSPECQDYLLTLLYCTLHEFGGSLEKVEAANE